MDTECDSFKLDGAHFSAGKIGKTTFPRGFQSVDHDNVAPLKDNVTPNGFRVSKCAASASRQAAAEASTGRLRIVRGYTGCRWPDCWLPGWYPSLQRGLHDKSGVPPCHR